jgi:hypothetical protein
MSEISAIYYGPMFKRTIGRPGSDKQMELK